MTWWIEKSFTARVRVQFSRVRDAAPRRPCPVQSDQVRLVHLESATGCGGACDFARQHSAYGRRV